MDLTAHRVFRNKREVHVGPIEFKLLQHLMSHPWQVFSRRQLLERVWGRDIHVILRTIDVHMSRLRKALNEGNEGKLHSDRSRRRVLVGRLGRAGAA